MLGRPADGSERGPALSGLETYLQLAARGWTAQRWERFVADSLAHALLR